MGSSALATAGSCCCSLNRKPNGFKSTKPPEGGRHGYTLLLSVWMMPVYMVPACVFVDASEAAADYFLFCFSFFWKLSTLSPSPALSFLFFLGRDAFFGPCVMIIFAVDFAFLFHFLLRVCRPPFFLTVGFSSIRSSLLLIPCYFSFFSLPFLAFLL